MSSLRDKLLDFGMVIVVVCGVVMTAVTLRAHLAGGVDRGALRRQAPELLDDSDWDQLVDVGHRIGPDSDV